MFGEELVPRHATVPVHALAPDVGGGLDGNVHLQPGVDFGGVRVQQVRVVPLRGLDATLERFSPPRLAGRAELTHREHAGGVTHVVKHRGDAARVGVEHQPLANPVRHRVVEAEQLAQLAVVVPGLFLARTAGGVAVFAKDCHRLPNRLIHALGLGAVVEVEVRHPHRLGGLPLTDLDDFFQHLPLGVVNLGHAVEPVHRVPERVRHPIRHGSVEAHRFAHGVTQPGPHFDGHTVPGSGDDVLDHRVLGAAGGNDNQLVALSRNLDRRNAIRLIAHRVGAKARDGLIHLKGGGRLWHVALHVAASQVVDQRVERGR